MCIIVDTYNTTNSNECLQLVSYARIITSTNINDVSVWFDVIMYSLAQFEKENMHTTHSHRHVSIVYAKQFTCRYCTVGDSGTTFRYLFRMRKILKLAGLLHVSLASLNQQSSIESVKRRWSFTWKLTLPIFLNGGQHPAASLLSNLALINRF